MRWARWMLVFATVTACLLVGTWALARARTLQTFGTLVHRVDTQQPRVALTFDDGPTPAALATLLPMLEQRHVRATFFVTGAELERRPALGAALLAAGHELGNHSYSHRRMLMLGQTEIANEIERTDALIRAAGQHGPIHFRPPYGLKLLGLPWYLQQTGRTTVMWDLEPDSDPAQAGDSEAMVANVLADARPGSIILLHVMYASRHASLASVPGIIDGLQARGFRFVTVSELMAVNGATTSSARAD